MTELALAKQRSVSKMFGDSTQVLSLQSDFIDLCHFWEMQMEEQKNGA